MSFNGDWLWQKCLMEADAEMRRRKSVSGERLREIEATTKDLIYEVRRLRDSIVSLNQDLDSMRDERDEALARVKELEANKAEEQL